MSFACYVHNTLHVVRVVRFIRVVRVVGVVRGVVRYHRRGGMAPQRFHLANPSPSRWSVFVDPLSFNDDFFPPISWIRWTTNPSWLSDLTRFGKSRIFSLPLDLIDAISASVFALLGNFNHSSDLVLGHVSELYVMFLHSLHKHRMSDIATYKIQLREDVVEIRRLVI